MPCAEWQESMASGYIQTGMKRGSLQRKGTLVTQSGSMMHLHNTPTYVTLGITSSVPCLPLPNLLLIARTRVLCTRSAAEAHEMELKRLLPLRYVTLSIHNKVHRLLKLRTVSEKKYYLQLLQKYSDQVFQLWTRLVHILHSGLSITPKDPSINVPYNFMPKTGNECFSDSCTDDSWVDSAEELPRTKKKFKFLERRKSKLEHKKGIKKVQDSFAQDTAKPAIAREKKSKQGDHPRRLPCSCQECEFCLDPVPILVNPKPSNVETGVNEALQQAGGAGYGIWLRGTTSGLMPLSLLNSLVAVGELCTLHS
ncbi:protein FAM71F1-like isoform X2 [Rhinatrema bivittatum]|uniref:protein FAM71F1-like isoform X2 n=1 Tax=Rhinatrema bivittatum TaxID=194408 RepID=UPI0011270A68|nr:protein FAM71F1-like isoform X2 [Rhinatrema bivittatum]